MIFYAACNGKDTGSTWEWGFSVTRCFSPPVGVLLPLHHLRGLHHAALQHARCHHRQRAHLLLAHHCAKRLPVCDTRGQGAPGLAGR